MTLEGVHLLIKSRDMHQPLVKSTYSLVHPNFGTCHGFGHLNEVPTLKGTHTGTWDPRSSSPIHAYPGVGLPH